MLHKFQNLHIQTSTVSTHSTLNFELNSHIEYRFNKQVRVKLKRKKKANIKSFGPNYSEGFLQFCADEGVVFWQGAAPSVQDPFETDPGAFER